MRLIIISGRSGSGKSTALHVLEDIGFTCIDNLPASLLPNLVEQLNLISDKPYAVSIDARNSESDIEQLPNLMKTPAIATLEHHIIFLDAADEVLLQRYSETRRRHPLSDIDTDLREAIAKEKALLKPIIDVSDITIDTTDMGFHDLRDFIKRQIMSYDNPHATLLFQSFGFKHGLPRDSDLVFDVRCLPNPHWQIELRSLTGHDQAVIDYFNGQEEVLSMFNDICGFLTRWLPCFEANNRSYITVSIGCTGGRHRSVFLCNKLAQHFNQTLDNVQCRHRELNNDH